MPKPQPLLSLCGGNCPVHPVCTAGVAARAHEDGGQGDDGDPAGGGGGSGGPSRIIALISRAGESTCAKGANICWW